MYIYIYIHIHIYIYKYILIVFQYLSEEVLEIKLLTIYVPMEKQGWEESAKRQAEERRAENRKSQAKEDAGAQKGRQVANHCVSPLNCFSSGGSTKYAS